MVSQSNRDWTENVVSGLVQCLAEPGIVTSNPCLFEVILMCKSQVLHAHENPCESAGIDSPIVCKV